jgi:hypothetical protein
MAGQRPKQQWFVKAVITFLVLLPLWMLLFLSLMSALYDDSSEKDEYEGSHLPQSHACA